MIYSSFPHSSPLQSDIKKWVSSSHVGMKNVINTLVLFFKLPVILHFNLPEVVWHLFSVAWQISVANFNVVNI